MQHISERRCFYLWYSVTDRNCLFNVSWILLCQVPYRLRNSSLHPRRLVIYVADQLVDIGGGKRLTCKVLYVPYELGDAPSKTTSVIFAAHFFVVFSLIRLFLKRV